jgi:hypothetical protein
MTLLDRIRPRSFGTIGAVLLSLSLVALPLFANGTHEQPHRVADLRNPDRVISWSSSQAIELERLVEEWGPSAVGPSGQILVTDKGTSTGLLRVGADWLTVTRFGHGPGELLRIDNAYAADRGFVVTGYAQPSMKAVSISESGDIRGSENINAILSSVVEVQSGFVGANGRPGELATLVESESITQSPFGAPTDFGRYAELLSSDYGFGLLVSSTDSLVYITHASTSTIAAYRHDGRLIGTLSMDTVGGENELERDGSPSGRLRMIFTDLATNSNGVVALSASSTIDAPEAVRQTGTNRLGKVFILADDGELVTVVETLGRPRSIAINGSDLIVCTDGFYDRVFVYSNVVDDWKD